MNYARLKLSLPKALSSAGRPWGLRAGAPCCFWITLSWSAASCRALASQKLAGPNRNVEVGAGVQLAGGNGRIDQAAEGLAGDADPRPPTATPNDSVLTREALHSASL